MIPHRGMPVLFPPLRGWGSPSYAKVTRVTSPHTVRIKITADSGGRKKGTCYDTPLTRLTARSRGRHRRSRGSPIRNLL